MGKGGGGANIDNHDRLAYLHLSATVLAAFARVPELAAAPEMLSKIPLFLEVLRDQYVFLSVVCLFWFDIFPIEFMVKALNFIDITSQVARFYCV